MQSILEYEEEEETIIPANIDKDTQERVSILFPSLFTRKCDPKLEAKFNEFFTKQQNGLDFVERYRSEIRKRIVGEGDEDYLILNEELREKIRELEEEKRKRKRIDFVQEED